MGLPGDELDIAALAARRRALRLAKKGPQPAASQSTAEAASQPASAAGAAPSIAGRVQSSVTADVRARGKDTNTAERPLAAAGALRAARPGVERSTNGATAAAEADLPADAGAAEALSELPKDAAESVIVAEEQRSSFKRQQAAAIAAAAQRKPAASVPADSGDGPSADSGVAEVATPSVGSLSEDAGQKPAAAGLRAEPQGPVRTKLSADGWLQSRLAELEHRVDSLSTAAEQGNAPFASLSLSPYGVGLSSTPSAVPRAASSDVPAVALDREANNEATAAGEAGQGAADAPSAAQQAWDGVEAAGSAELPDSPTALAAAVEDATDAGASSAAVADAGAIAEAAGAAGDDRGDALDGTAHGFLSPVRRLTGAVPTFFRRRWQQMHGGDALLAPLPPAPVPEEAARMQTGAPQQLAERLDELSVSAAPHEVLLPDPSQLGQAIFGPVRRVRPQTVAAQSQAQARQAPARLDAAMARGVEHQHTGPVRLQQFRLTSPQHDRQQPRMLAAPAVTQRLANEPAWSAGTQPESPPKFSQQRCALRVAATCVLLPW